MASEVFEIFDDENRCIGTATRDQVHREGLYHRSVHVFMLNPDGELLVQQRATDKDVCPGLWDLSVAEHAQPGECPFQTALRGLREELSVEATVSLVAPFHLNVFTYPDVARIDREFVQTFRCDGVDRHQADGVEGVATQWLSLIEIGKRLAANPDEFTPWFKRDFPLLTGGTSKL